MRVGICLLTDVPWSEARERWQAAEAYGFDHAWTFDHLRWGGLPDADWRGALPTLAAAASVTASIGLGTFVASPNYRHPYLLYRDAQAVEDVADGRLLLGLGTGGDLDSRIVGGPALPLRERVDRFQEFVEVLHALRSADDPLTRGGAWFPVESATTSPGLRAPFVVAANGPRSIRFAARAGDAWVTTGPPLGDLEGWLAGLGEASRRFEDELVALGRDPGDVRRFVNPDSTPHIESGVRYALSSVAFFEELAGRLGELGFTDVVTNWPREDTVYVGTRDVLEQVAADVLPRLHAHPGE